MNMEKVEKIIEVRWSDCDPNRHVRHSAYYEYGAHIRIDFFAKIGFDADQMNHLNIGPILFKEECSFLKEIRPGESIKINLLKGDISEDGGRWVLHHELFNQQNEKSAHITVKGAWIDLELRKLTVPPPALAKVLLELPEGEYFTYGK